MTDNYCDISLQHTLHIKYGYLSHARAQKKKEDPVSRSSLDPLFFVFNRRN